MTRQTSRRQRPERSEHQGSQEASSGGNQASIFITRDEMEVMMRRQEEMIQNLLQQIGQIGAQIQGATGIQNGAGPSGAAPELGGTHAEHVDPTPGSEMGASEPPGSNRGMNVQPGRHTHGNSRGLGGQVEDSERELQLGDNDRLAEMVRRAMRGGLVNRDLEDVNRSPFSSAIRMARNPPEFKLPSLDMYNGKTDPTVHLTKYMRHMEVLGASEEVMARCFPLYLTDIAALWFRQLESGSIGTWADLTERFMRQFRVHIARPKNVMTLATLKQKTGETLRSFLTRFNAAAASVDRPDPSMVMMAAVSGIVDSTEFKNSLTKDPPMNLGEFYHEAEKFLRLEDASAEREEEDDVYVIKSGNPPGKGAETSKGKRKAEDNDDRSKWLRREPRFTTYSELNESLERIYQDTKGQVPYRRPMRRDPTSDERKSDKFCVFHELNGHNTNDCRHLKYEVEGHIRNGMLLQYVRRRTPAVEPERPPSASARGDPGSGHHLIIH